MDYKDKVKRYYDYTLRFYRVFWHGNTRALHYGIWDDSTKNLKEALLNTNKFLAEKAGIKAGEQVLDAGSGVGGSAFWLANNIHARVTGITISEQQLKKAEELRVRLGLQSITTFSLQDFTKTDFPDGSFDVVWAIESVCHAVHKIDFLREAHRILKPGGRIIIADGFMHRKAKDKQEERMLDNFMQGLALDNLAESTQFVDDMKTAGFTHIQMWDKTAAILRTSQLMARICWWGWPLSVLTSWLHLTPELIAKNNRAGIEQLRLVERGIMTYQVLLGRK